MGKRSGARGAVSMLMLAFVAVAPAWAQDPARPAGRLPSNRLAGRDSLPPLADTLRLYGADLAVRTPLSTFEVPPGALPLSLDEAIRLALERNPTRRASLLEAERAANDATRGNAGFLPTLDAGAGLSGNQSYGIGGSTSSGAGGASASRARGATSLSTDLSVGYTVFDGNRRTATLARLRADARRFALLSDADAEVLVRDVAVAYLDVLRQTALEGAQAEQVTLSEDRLRVQSAQTRIGTAADVDAALALADLNADRAGLLRQRLALQAARIELGALLALEDPDAVVATDSLGEGIAPAPLAVDTSGVRNRDVRALRAAEDAAREAIREARADYAPTVRVQAGPGLTFANPSFYRPATPTLTPSLGYGFTAVLPLFDGRQRDRRLANARLQARQAALDTDAARLRLRADVSRLAATDEGFRQLAALETQNVAIARANARVALAQLELGFITSLDLRQVQLALLDAESRRIDARYQALLAATDLRLRAGDLLPADAAIAPAE